MSDITVGAHIDTFMGSADAAAARTAIGAAASGGSGSPGGSDAQVQFNDAGSFGGSPFLTLNKTSGAVSKRGSVIALSSFLDTSGTITVDVTKDYSTAIISANKTVAFSNAPSYSAWATITVYAVGDKVKSGGVNYTCLTAHTSGTFATDLAAGKWAVAYQVFSLFVQNTDSNFAHYLTIPRSFSLAKNISVTSVAIPPAVSNIITGLESNILLTWQFDGTLYRLTSGELTHFNANVEEYSTIYGERAAVSAASGCILSAFFGYEAGGQAPNGGQMVGVGYKAGYNPGGYAGTFVGYNAGGGGGGTSAVGIGYSSLASADRAGTGNVAIGVHAAETVTNISGGIVVGYHAANGATNASNSVIIGDHAATGLANMNNSVFIGPYTGVSRNNTLWIDGRATAIGSIVPMFYGEFDNQKLSLNATVLVGQTASASAVADASAAFEVRSTTKGLLLPRMTKTQRDAIASPIAGLAVFQTDNTPGLRVYNGTNWMKYTEAID